MALLSPKHRAAFTVIELVVVMFIVSLLGTITVSFIVKSLRDQERLQAQALVQSQLTAAVERAAKVIRGTTVIIQAQQNLLTIRGWANVADSAPSEISYYLDENNAWKFSVVPASGAPPNYVYNPDNKKIFTLVDRVVNDNNQPLFLYYDELNNQLSFPVSVSAVKMIELSPRALDLNNWLISPIELTTRVNLRNLKTNL